MPTPQEKYHQHAALCESCSAVDLREVFSVRCPIGVYLVDLAVKADIAEGRCHPNGQSFSYPKHKGST
jgi:hypothetical protein